MNKIAVIGCGGTGSFLLPLLLRMVKEDEITLFDGDSFTKENLDRQLFRPEQVGANKAKALALTYKSPRLKHIQKFLTQPEQLEDFDLIIACPDNHVARMRVLTAADQFEIPVILCGNEYNSASATVYLPEWGGTKFDPRIRYPEITTDLSGSPTERSCTGEAQEESPQLALANNASAVQAIQLMYFWFLAMTEELQNDKEAYEFFPIEFSWVPSKTITLRVKDVEGKGKEDDKSPKNKK